MNFFTIEWWQGAMEDDETEAVYPRYQQRLDAIRDRLPLAFRQLAEGIPPIHLHDARLLDLHVDLQAARATLSFMEYGMDKGFALIYDGLLDVRATGNPKMGLDGPYGFGDLGYDEKDALEDGSLEHRLLFSNGIELDLRFTGFAVELRQFEAAAKAWTDLPIKGPPQYTLAVGTVAI
jgi:hypothetical protein